MYRNNDIDYIKYLRGKKVIIWGAGNQGKRVAGNLSKNVEDISIIAFCDNDEKKRDKSLMGGGGSDFF